MDRLLKMAYPITKFTPDSVLRQRILIEKQGAEIHYIERERNAAADAISRLPIKEKQ